MSFVYVDTPLLCHIQTGQARPTYCKSRPKGFAKSAVYIMQKTTHHELYSRQIMCINKIWRRSAVSPRGKRQCRQPAWDYSNCSSREIKQHRFNHAVMLCALQIFVFSILSQWAVFHPLHTTLNVYASHGEQESETSACKILYRPIQTDLYCKVHSILQTVMTQNSVIVKEFSPKMLQLYII